MPALSIVSIIYFGDRNGYLRHDFSICHVYRVLALIFVDGILSNVVTVSHY